MARNHAKRSGALMLAKGAGETIRHRPHQVSEECALSGFDEYIGRHSGRWAKVLDLVAYVSLVETHPDDKRVSPYGVLFTVSGHPLTGGGICRYIHNLALDHRRQALIQSRQPNQGALLLPDVCYFIRAYS